MATEDTPTPDTASGPPAAAADKPLVTNEPVTVAGALANAARLLTFAERETNLATMERLEALADSWNSLARTAIAAAETD